MEPWDAPFVSIHNSEYKFYEATTNGDTFKDLEWYAHFPTEKFTQA